MSSLYKGKKMERNKIIKMGILIIAILLIPVKVYAERYDEDYSEGYVGNQDYQNYSTYGSVITSYLVNTSNGFMRVQYENGNIDIYYYDYGYELLSSKSMSCELPLFGGFYEGSDSYYIVVGQKNPKESDDQEVVRVIRYDKNWNRIAATSCMNCNTNTPFDFGSLRMTECDGKLYVLTSKLMYKSSDGLNHQSNLSFVIDINSMSLLDVGKVAYVSHSFNQFIIADDQKNIVSLNHGDAYPRAFRLSLFENEPNSTNQYNKSNVSSEIYSFAGETGDNETYASVGGLEYSSNNYIVAANSAVQDGNNIDHRNIMLLITPRALIEEAGTRYTKRQFGTTTTVWLTTGETTEEEISTPHLVKINDNKFLVLWRRYKGNKNYVEYVFVDENGNKLSTVYSVVGELSDCKPVVVGNQVIWYVYNNDCIVFYSVDMNGNLSINKKFYIPLITELKNVDKGISISWEPVYNATAYEIYKSSDGYPCKRFKKVSKNKTTLIDKSVKNGVWYGYKVRAIVDGKKGPFCEFDGLVRMKKITGLKAKRKGRNLTVSFEKVKEAIGYQVEYSTDKTFKKKKMVKCKNNIKVIHLPNKKQYYVRVRFYMGRERYNRIYSPWTKVKRVK